MKWNIEELQQKIKKLENRINLVTNEIEKQKILLDLCNLKEMINYSSGKVIYPKKELDINVNVLDTEYVVDMINFMNENKKNILLSLDNILSLKTLPKKNKEIKKIVFSQYEILLNNFLKNINLYDLYEKYKSNNQIEFNKNRYIDSKTCLGICRHILADGKSYISVRYLSQIKEPTILPHELAHAYQFNNDKSLYSVQNKIKSLLCEAYPTFIEYAFLDFLKETEYKEFAFLKEAVNLDSLLCTIEYNTNYLEDENINSNLESELNTLLLSKIVALYWLEMYRNDSKSALIEIDKFNLYYGKNLVSEFFKENNLNDIVSSVYSEMNYYLSNYRKR